MKWSRFNFLSVTSSGQRCLYNSYSNCLLRLENDLYEALSRMSEFQGEIDVAILGLFSESEIEYFKKNYILVEDDETLVEMLHMHSMERLCSKKALVLTIAPTQSCNFGCTYCFERNRHSSGMTDCTENSIVEYIKYQMLNYGLESLNITWYGGEPLLEYKRILSLSKRINALNLEINENMLITNGYFFTIDIIKNLVNTGIKDIQITLDGNKDIHDKRRPLLSGKGTFDKIIENLDNYFYSEYKDCFNIALRVNVDRRNYKDFFKLRQWLVDRYKSDKLHVYPGIVVLDEKDENYSVCLRRNEVTNMFLDIYKKYNIQFEELYPDDINIECMARSPHSMLIGSNGEIYKCYEELGEQKCIVGNINDKNIWTSYERIAKYFTGIDHYNDLKCRKCSYLPICREGCPIRRIENVYEDRHNDCCTPFKGRIDEYIELYLNTL